ncbi:MAG TPA: sodium:solute symporter family protein [Phycisphaerales bacterium]|nr:sodium:solute symporter family protein [Phycisphaerales bacterium]
METNLITETNFSAVDWVIVIVYPMISLGIGIFVSKFIKNMNDFVCAGKGLGTALGVATLTGTELGLITVMYSSQKAFNGGFATFHIALIAGVVTFFVGVSGFFLYRLREMQVLTIPEFYERRFDRKTRILGGIMMAFGGILNMGLFLKIGSMFIVGITGLSENSWALPTVMVFLISMVLIYTCLGGMVSVVIADYVQFVVLSFGMLLATFLAIRNLGWDNIFNTVAEIKKEAGFNPIMEGSGFGIEYIMFVAFIGLVSCAIWPTSVSRALSAESPKTVKKQFTFASISYMIRFLLPYFWGICAFVWIMNEGGALKEAFFPSAEGAEAVDNLYAMPMFLGHILPAGVIGLITAAMLAAFMSTHDSYLLCWSSVLTQDVIAPLMGDKLTAKKRIVITRVLIVVIGLWVLAWGLLYKGSLDIFDYMGVTGAIYFAGAFALLLGGLYWKRASSTGAFLALLAGSSAILGLGPIQNLVKETFNITITAPRATLTSVALTTTAMIVGSLLFPDKKSKADAVKEFAGKEIK